MAHSDATRYALAEPILDFQTFNTLKLGHIVGYKNQSFRHCVRRDQKSFAPMGLPFRSRATRMFA